MNRPYRSLETAVTAMARAMAMAGGAALVLLVVLVCVSVTGRSLSFTGFGPVRGDFEWVEFGVGFAIFAFLPWTQLSRGHARVDLFANRFGNRLNRLLDLAADLLMSGAAVIIAHRLFLGLLDKHRYGETTFIAQVPVWIGYAAGLIGAVAFAVVALFCVLRSLRALAGVPDEPTGGAG